ncbi:probable voltage-dependent N-type calcium channel subunit alpha-1B isoform X5 [Hydra vulgaris]|uniref:Probable voltage-dependent N-type calcium channel subunit alpha-1B isoform X5 n=1 Tax=Hydra vulgaris TaxID=6087 RepID=A0ABM4C2H4_HYDVU
MAARRRSSVSTRAQSVDLENLYPHNHLFVLKPDNPFRKACVSICTSKTFESFIMLVIAGNCVMMAMNTPLPNDDKSNLNIKLEALDVYLLAIFMVEAFLKIVSQGFILHRHSYMRTPWNILDFVVIVTGILPYAGLQGGPTKVIKAAKVLRPLKLVSGVPSLQLVMSAILKSMGSLMEISLLIGFVIVIYAIIGISLLMGMLRQTCVYTSNNTIAIDQFLCGTSDTGGRPCPDGTECLKFWSGPSSGITSFDNILLGCITVFQCMTGEGWTDIMYAVFKVFDYKARFTWIYFYSLNVIGAQFMLNLVCGVLSGEFSKENERVANRDEFLRQRAELAAERAIEKYEGWVDEGELAAAKELEESLKIQEQIEDQGEVIVPPLTGLQQFLLRNAVVRAKLKAFMLSNFMYWLVIGLVFLNSVSGMMQYYQQSQWISDVINITDNFFLAFFFLEMCLKFYALGPIEYFQSKFNFFDCVVVFASIINWLLSRFLSINLGVSVLRQLRLMRLFKFTSHWSSLKALIASILASMTSIMSLVVLLLLFLMIFGLLGMQLFGGQLYVTNPRSNFDDFFNAVLTVFQIVTGEDWNNTMYEGINAMGGALNAVGLAVSLYYILCTSLGNFVLLNVFLAIAVDNISLTADEKEQVEEENGAREEHLKEIHEKYSSSINEEEEVEQIDELNEENIVGEFDSYPSNGTVAKPGDNFLENLKNPARMLPQPFKPKILDQRTLFFLEPTNIIRRIVHEIISYAYFDNIILALILISSALLACEDVTDPDALVNVILGYSDYGFTAIFTLEALLKIINFGGFLHPGSFFRDAWNCVDMFVVTCSIMSIILSMNKKTASKTIKLIIKVLRILRVLRPLKVINKLPKLKAVFVCMIFSLKNVVMVLIITAQLLLIFSIMGVQLFSGLYWYCTDESKDNQNDCVGYYITFQSNNYNQPIEKTRDWVLYTFNFEDTVSAFITLFTSSTGDGWYIHMQHGIDSTEEHNGPIRNNKIWVSIYFLMFVVIFSFFFINVFVGMIILTFQELAAAESGLELDRNTKNSLIFAMTAKPMERFMPEDIKSLKYTAWSLIESQPWEMLITSLIIMNIITMIIEYEGEPLSFNNFMASVSTIFSFVFVFEFAIKFFALGFNYFKDFWNVFDMFIVFGGLLDFCIKTFFPQSNFPTSIFRLFRALRLVKLLRRSRSLRILLWTFLKSFQVFSQISIDPKDDPWGQINEDNNFRSYFSSTQVLFRIATGENWPNIMKACTTGAMCDLNMKSYDGSSEQCGTPLAYIYFISFIFFCTFLMLNLFIAVIMDNFSFLTEDSSILGPHHLDEVVTVWSDFDPRATGRIKHTEVCELLRQMAPPVGLGRKCPKILAYKRLVKMNMTLYKDGSVDFTGLFFALVRTGLQVYTENANLKSNELAFRKMLKREFPNISKRTTDLIIPRTPKDSTHMTIGKVYSAKLIWENYKNMRNNNLRRKSIYCTEAISDT